jgi:hypothetical protein
MTASAPISRRRSRRARRSRVALGIQSSRCLGHRSGHGGDSVAIPASNRAFYASHAFHQFDQS